jgi:hypothetical protein
LALTALFMLEFVVVSRHFEVAGGGTVLRGSRRGAAHHHDGLRAWHRHQIVILRSACKARLEGRASAGRLQRPRDLL